MSQTTAKHKLRCISKLDKCKRKRGRRKITLDLDAGNDFHMLNTSDEMYQSSRHQVVLRNMTARSHRLLPNQLSNCAEIFTNIVCKYVSGKRINYAKRGSYSRWVDVAALAFNNGDSGLSKESILIESTVLLCGLNQINFPQGANDKKKEEDNLKPRYEKEE
ncbi:hypothetical protein ILUMI_18508 [Ignelater luminosus]|uniref:Uncharacterized protein n=1 Tax=Ignelater luminosus TaxID=2038154 RepID=A0A8K0CQ10_IGNLU|nr:hypothetical protein ILUMI_18508 [Ignelater luminosus]